MAEISKKYISTFFYRKDESIDECIHITKTGDYCIKCGAVCYNNVSLLFLKI